MSKRFYNYTGKGGATVSVGPNMSSHFSYQLCEVNYSITANTTATRTFYVYKNDDSGSKVLLYSLELTTDATGVHNVSYAPNPPISMQGGNNVLISFAGSSTESYRLETVLDF